MISFRTPHFFSARQPWRGWLLPLLLTLLLACSLSAPPAWAQPFDDAATAWPSLYAIEPYKIFDAIRRFWP